MAHPILTYDFTASKTDNDLEEIKSLLDHYCREWVFQAEKGLQTGYEHYQGRIKLKTKKRLTTLRKDLSSIRGIHLSPTSNANVGNNFYVMKDESRIEGPWFSEGHEDGQMPWDLEEVKELLPWQDYVYKNIVKQRSKRGVDLIYDPDGNTGKTTLTRWLLWHKHAEWIPYCESYKELVQIVMDLPRSPCYMIDLPRALPKRNLEQMYSALETVKGGYAYDTRYEFRRRIFNPPRVIVFTNVLPPDHYFTSDRWNIWTIKNKELVKFIPPQQKTSVADNFDYDPEIEFTRSNDNYDYLADY